LWVTRSTESDNRFGVFSMYEGVTFYRTWGKNKILSAVNQTRDESENWFDKAIV
jgi:hypothetical protein